MRQRRRWQPIGRNTRLDLHFGLMDETTSLRVLEEAKKIASRLEDLTRHTANLEDLGGLASRLEDIARRLESIEQAIRDR